MRHDGRIASIVRNVNVLRTYEILIMEDHVKNAIIYRLILLRRNVRAIFLCRRGDEEGTRLVIIIIVCVVRS